MRVFLGMILGAALTVGAAYAYDRLHAPALATVPPGSEQIAARPLVNWDVVSARADAVGREIHQMTAWLRAEWNKRSAS